MAAGADLGVWLVVGDVGVAIHAGSAVGAHSCPVNIVAGGALEMTLVSWVARNSMKPGELLAFVTAAARRPGGYGPAVRLVTGHAFPMPFWALGQLLLVTARTGHHAGELVRRSFMTRTAARMTKNSAS